MLTIYKELLTVVHDLLLLRMKREQSTGYKMFYMTVAIVGGAMMMKEYLGY